MDNQYQLLLKAIEEMDARVLIEGSSISLVERMVPYQNLYNFCVHNNLVKLEQSKVKTTKHEIRVISVYDRHQKLGIDGQPIELYFSGDLPKETILLYFDDITISVCLKIIERVENYLKCVIFSDEIIRFIDSKDLKQGTLLFGKTYDRQTD